VIAVWDGGEPIPRLKRKEIVMKKVSRKFRIAVFMFFVSLMPFMVYAEDPPAVGDAAKADIGQSEGAKSFFSKTELQLHADFNRHPQKDHIWTLTLEHYSVWKYGDNFFFMDSEGARGLKTSVDTVYFEYSPRISMDRVSGVKILPVSFLGDVYVAGSYNAGRSELGSTNEYIHDAFLYGISFDFAFQPNFGFSNITFYVRNEHTQSPAYQITLAWGQPFDIGMLRFSFNGFADFWKDDQRYVFLTEPQLRLHLSSFVGKGHLLSDSVIGTEVEISKDFFGKDENWVINPTVFFAYTF